MKPNRIPNKRLLIRKLATFLLVSASFAAFATLGDGGGKPAVKAPVSLPLTPRSFSLKSTQNFRKMYFNNSKTGNFIMLNTVVTYQKGNTTYVLPLKKKVLLDKVKFNVNTKSPNF